MIAPLILLLVGCAIAGGGAWLIRRAEQEGDGGLGDGLFGVMACFVAFLIVLVALLRLWTR